MTTTIQRPNEYIDLTDDELDDIDGGIAPLVVVGIVTGAKAVGGGLYHVGMVAGQRAYYAGLRNSS